MSFDKNSDCDPACEPYDTQEISSDYEGEVEASTKKRRKPKAKFQRLSKARQLANARERRRAQRIHDGFSNLAQHVPQEPSEEGRLSRMEILQRAIDYIRHLEDLLGIQRDGPPKADSLCSNAAQSSAGSSSGAEQSMPPTTARSALSSNGSAIASGEVPAERCDSVQSRSQCCELDISAIDFDIDEDLSDIPASPDDVYNDLESIISSSSDVVGSTGSIYSSSAQVNSSVVEQPNGLAMPPYFHQFLSSQSREGEFVLPDSTQPHPVARAPVAPPPYTRAIATSPSPTVSVTSTGAELSTHVPQVSSPLVPFLEPGKRPPTDMPVHVQPPAKRICPTTSSIERSSLPPSYFSQDFQRERFCHSGLFGGPLPSMHSLRSSICSV